MYTEPDDLLQIASLPNYQLAVKFIDGTEGIIVMKDLIFSKNAGVFASLKNPDLFNQVHIEHGVATWPGEIDLAPDVMYEQIKKHGIWTLE